MKSSQFGVVYRNPDRAVFEQTEELCAPRPVHPGEVRDAVVEFLVPGLEEHQLPVDHGPQVDPALLRSGSFFPGLFGKAGGEFPQVRRGDYPLSHLSNHPAIILRATAQGEHRQGDNSCQRAKDCSLAVDHEDSRSDHSRPAYTVANATRPVSVSSPIDLRVSLMPMFVVRRYPR